MTQLRPKSLMISGLRDTRDVSNKKKGMGAHITPNFPGVRAAASL